MLQSCLLKGPRLFVYGHGYLLNVPGSLVSILSESILVVVYNFVSINKLYYFDENKFFHYIRNAW